MTTRARTARAERARGTTHTGRTTPTGRTGRTRTIAAVAGGAALVATLFAAAPAGAATRHPGATHAVPFGHARFRAYSSGEMAYANLLGSTYLGSTGLADLEAAFTGSSVNSAGLRAQIIGDSQNGSLVIQPAVSASRHAYATGGGLAGGLDALSKRTTLLGQIFSVASPNRGTVSKQTLSAAALGAPASLISSGILDARASSHWNPNACPPAGTATSSATGRVANAKLLNLSQLSNGSALTGRLNTLLAPLAAILATLRLPGLPTASTTGYLVSSSGVSQTVAETLLHRNTGGTYGVTALEQEKLAPININLLGLAQVRILVGSQITGSRTLRQSPISLAATATGQHKGAEVSLGDDALIEVQLSVGGTTTNILPPTSLGQVIGGGGMKINLSVGSILAPYLSKLSIPSSLLARVLRPLDSASLGSIDLATPVRAINGTATSRPTPSVVGRPSTTEGNRASGAFDLAHLVMAPKVPHFSATIANLHLGHMEADAVLRTPIGCAK
jgi:hypothetical protein